MRRAAGYPDGEPREIGCPITPRPALSPGRRNRFTLQGTSKGAAVTREKWLDPSNWASLKPFGIGEEHPNNYLELWSAFKENRDQARYAWRILTQGVEPDLPMRIQRRELPASLDPHLAVGVPRHQPSSPEPSDPPRRSATGP
jgi:hypothetical protein